MGQQTNPSQRQCFFVLHQEGLTYGEIAERMQVSKTCVRYWCRHQRDGKSCQTHYSRKPRGLLSYFHPRVRYVILRLRLEHPHWGPNRILCKLRPRPSLLGLHLPSEAEIGRYLHQWRRFRRKPKKKPVRERQDQPTRVHQCWQIDFKVDLCLQDGTRFNLFTIRDPVGEAYIGDFVYETCPHRRIRMEEVRAVLRRSFERWETLPEIVQTDGESTLVSSHQNDFPSRFTLWLTGLGIQHQVIHNVTSNAAVERCHRTICDFAVLGNEDQPLQAFQQILDQATYELNYELPSQAQGCDGKAPIVAHPELLQPPRPYQATRELSLFDLQRVDQYLAGLVWKYRVAGTGQVDIGHHRHRCNVSRTYAGKEVEVRFDPQDRHWVFSPLEHPEQVIRRCPARGLEVADLTGLDDWPVGPGPQQLFLPYLFDKRGNFLMSK